MTEEETVVEDFVQGYGLRQVDERKIWQPSFEVVTLICTHAGGVSMGVREEHVSWHWTFKKGRKALNDLHAALIQKAFVDSWYGSQVRNPDGPPLGFDGSEA